MAAGNPSNFTVLGNEVLFNGTDANGQAGVWETNGTSSGTHELTGINGAYTGLGGLNPQDLTDPVVGTGTSVLSVGSGETLTGGNGPNFGDATITNFNVHDDTIELPKSEFATLAAVLADAHQVDSSPPGLDHVIALFNQYAAAGLPRENGTLLTNPVSQIVANEQQFLAQPHHG